MNIPRRALLKMAPALAIYPTIGTPKPRLLVVGNSITHSSPAPEYEWSGNWGMAASDADHDFAHILARALGADLEADNLLNWELAYSSYHVAQAVTMPADYVVIRLGDNVPWQEYTSARYTDAFHALVSALCPSPTKLVITSTYYSPGGKSINDDMRAVCDEAGGAWVDLTDLVDDSRNHASRDPVPPVRTIVGLHPSNRGHARIAERILVALGPAKTVCSVSIPFIAVRDR
jgi:hypothetical protein